MKFGSQRAILDYRDEKKKYDHLFKIKYETLSEEFDLWGAHPQILFSDSENVKYPTEPSIFRQEIYGRMFLAMRGQTDFNQHETYWCMWNDDRPYKMLKDGIVEFPGHMTTVGHDRRPKEEMLAEPYVVFCFRDEDKAHKIGRLDLTVGELGSSGEMLMSKEVIEDECFEVMVMKKDLIVTFHAKCCRVYDEWCEPKPQFEIHWDDVLAPTGVTMKRLGSYSVAKGWDGFNDGGIICSFTLERRKVQQIPFHAQYNERLASYTNEWEGWREWIIRLKAKDDATGLVPYKWKEESILWRDERPRAIVEWGKNKMLITGDPTHMYMVHDWEKVFFIEDEVEENYNKNLAVTMCCFDEVKFPQIAICSKKYI